MLETSNTISFNINSSIQDSSTENLYKGKHYKLNYTLQFLFSINIKWYIIINAQDTRKTKTS